MPRLIALLAVLALAGCGGSDPMPEEEVRETLRTFATSVEERDAEQLCGILDPELLEGLTGQGLPCAVAMERQFFTSVRSPKLEVGKVTVDGDTATAAVKTSAAGQPSADATLNLRRVEGSWRVSAPPGDGGGPTGPSGPPDAAGPSGAAGPTGEAGD